MRSTVVDWVGCLPPRTLCKGWLGSTRCKVLPPAASRPHPSSFDAPGGAVSCRWTRSRVKSCDVLAATCSLLLHLGCVIHSFLFPRLSRETSKPRRNGMGGSNGQPRWVWSEARGRGLAGWQEKPKADACHRCGGSSWPTSPRCSLCPKALWVSLAVTVDGVQL